MEQNEVPLDGPTPKLSPAAASASSSSSSEQENIRAGTGIRAESAEEPAELSEGHICYVCRRRLGSAEMLRKHEELSALHQKNLRIARQAAQRRRQELRSDVVRLRYMISGGGLAASSPSADRELKRLESELGHVQQDMEGKNVSQSLTADMRIGKYIVQVSGETWMGNKSSNEDRMTLCINLGDSMKGCLIADGHCGDDCADYLIEHLERNIKSCLDKGLALDQALRQGFRKTDTEYLEYAVANEIPSGSTAIIAVFYLADEGQSLQCMTAHVGDSRAIACTDPTDSSKALRMTQDHKPDRDDEKARLSASGGHVVDVGGVWRVFTPNVVSIGGRTLQWGLAVSRAFGDLALKRPVEIVTADPEVSEPIKLNEHSRVVLACDGIFDVLTDEETLQAARQGGPGAVLRGAYGKLSDDNLTAIVCNISIPDINKEEDQAPESHRRPSVMPEPSGKKLRFSVEPGEEMAPEMVTPSQQI
jgi:serine/threonine protein phosphatase PrpC